MATKNDAFRTVLGQAWSDTFDSGTGTLEILDGATTLATFDINATQSSGVSAGVWTVDFDNATVTASANGTADGARMYSDSTPTHTVTAITVGTSGQQINFDNVSINSGQDVTLSSFTVTVPAATA